METVELGRLPTWEYLQKRMTWEQLGEIKGKRVLDFGSGNGACAAHFAALGNAVTAIEPFPPPLGEQFSGDYTFLEGSLEALEGLAHGSLTLSSATMCWSMRQTGPQWSGPWRTS